MYLRSVNTVSMILIAASGLVLFLVSAVAAREAPEDIAPAVPVSNAAPTGLERVEADVSRCRTAADAVLVYPGR